MLLADIEWQQIATALNENTGPIITGGLLLMIVIQCLANIGPCWPFTKETPVAAAAVGVTQPVALPDLTPADRIVKKISEALNLGVRYWTQTKTEGQRCTWKCVHPNFTALTFSASSEAGMSVYFNVGEERINDVIVCELLTTAKELDGKLRANLEEARLELALSLMNETIAPKTAMQPTALGCRLFEALRTALVKPNFWKVLNTDPSCYHSSPFAESCLALSFRVYNAKRIDVFVKNVPMHQLLTQEQQEALAALAFNVMISDQVYGQRFDELVKNAEKFAGSVSVV